MPDDLFRPIFVPDAFREAVGGRAWLAAMLRAEGALAVAEARAGLIPREAAQAIASCCDASLFDPGQIGRDARAAGNPVPALVEALTAAVRGVSEEAARHVHRGATSQDVTDTAAMLVAGGALDLILAEVDGVASACAALADGHRATVMAGRTLLQQALPVTFGLKAAGWLVAVLGARGRLVEVRAGGLAAQLGGAAGTLASLGEGGLPVLGEFARELGLAEPVVPWHTDRTRIGGLAGALSILAGVLEKICGDVVLMAQTEVGEVAEPAAPSRGSSSTLPHKRNPVLSVTAAASCRRVRDLAGTLHASMAQEHERAAGAWHAEWQALSEALALSGGAASAVREVAEGLEVRPGRMRENLGATDGLLLAESAAAAAARRGLGRREAHELVRAASQRALGNGSALREEILAEPALAGALSPEEIDAALDPRNYLGSSASFVDRALELYRKEVNA